MRLIAERLLPVATRGTTHVPGELHRQRVVLLPASQDGRQHHLYCSRHNVGALELVRELSEALSI